MPDAAAWGLPEGVEVSLRPQGKGMLGRDDMGPPELGQDLKAAQPVLAVPRDVKDGAPIRRPAVEVAPLTIKHVHEPLHLPAMQPDVRSCQ